MSDLISRQEISDIIKTRLYQTALNNDEYITSYAKACEDIAENRIDTWINEAKTVEPEQNLQPTCNQLATDCISRQAVIDRINKLIEVEKKQGTDDWGYGRERVNAYEAILHFVKSEYLYPSVEPERKKGKWEYIQYDGNPKIGNWHCSECRLIVNLGFEGEPYYHYCPSCGARMEVDG